MSNPAWQMRRALRLAEKGRGWVLPNPMVGAVILKGEERIGEGYHQKWGGPHAEIEALNSCTESPEGATLFVTLEPCCHHGKTPPCTEAIIKSGIKKVVVACKDPSKKVNGKGVLELEAAGITVEVGVLEEAARSLNEAFFTFHEKNRPFITLKMAISLDGKIAAKKGEESPITGEKTRRQVHILRKNHQAILVGAGTVLSDDPHLGVRLVEGNDPLRIILKGKRALPKTAKIFRDDNVLILENQNIEDLLDTLYEKGIVSILVEGGSEVFTAFLESKKVDRVEVFQAPLVLGEKALPFAALTEPLAFERLNTTQVGQDFWITMNLKGKR
ncbi:MAG: bifunctional diaminohydroxyphosphoribosylaminopyrimidine deaminase/5-amino-6-(5-phosphoribosylamino)uracil reductase RibD [Candidatus Gracilibacteria bacterium]|jgi:diaminohydroxyphosphoribosylaminopyrimidine deaminase/5-amino-6-(5-phosphoribosylamino)uracil reductase